MKHGHLTEQRKQFVEAYCRLGNGTLAAKEAGYKDSQSLVNQAIKLQLFQDFKKIILPQKQKSLFLYPTLYLTYFHITKLCEKEGWVLRKRKIRMSMKGFIIFRSWSFLNFFLTENSL